MADMIRPCTDQDFEDIFEVINDAAQAHQGVIPSDRFKDPLDLRSQSNTTSSRRQMGSR
jgi:hypothetical protein